MKLSLLPAEQLHIHEETIPHYLGELTERIRKDGIVKHPLIVEDKNYAILDGMHRYAALTKLGCKLIPAALVDYSNPRILVERWMRLTSYDSNLPKLFDALAQPLMIHSLSLREVGSEGFAENLLEEHLGYIKLLLKDHSYFVEGTPTDLFESYALLREVQEALEREDFKVHVRTEKECRAKIESDGKHASFAGPRISKEDVLNAVASNRVFPPKVTRHVLPLRFFNVDVPLELLQVARSEFENSNKLFIERLKARERKTLPSGQTFEDRYYDEEIIVFQ